AGFVLLTALLLLAACGRNAAVPATLVPTVEPVPPGHIVTIGPDGNVHVMLPDGSGQIDITKDARSLEAASELPQTYLLPTWAPSGDKLTYGSIAGSVSGPRQVQVEVANADGSGHRVVFESETETPIYLSWDPSGDKVGVLTSGSAGSPLGLWIAESGRSTLVDRGQPYYWDWSDGGQFIVAHVGGSASANPMGARLSTITASDGDRLDWSLQPSAFQAPAGRPNADSAVVASVKPEGGAELLLVGPNGEVQQRLAPVTGTVAMDWSPDGQQLAYVEQLGAPHEGFGRLTILRLNDSPLARPVPTGLDLVVAFDWSPAGDRLAALVPRVVAKGGQQSVANRSLQADLQFELYIVQADTGEPALLTVFQPTDAFLEMLPFYDQYQRASTMWSPDGKFLTFSGRRADGTDGVYVLEATAGSTASIIADGEIAYWSFK
ncbi:MAG: hypothetical protein WBR18_04410, partial [Anaerolineales bacterium]